MSCINTPGEPKTMRIPFTMRVSVPPDVLTNSVEGQSVLLNLQNERYYGLDDVGTRMWTTLTTAPSIERAFESLLAEYDVDGDRLRDDLCSLIEKLVEHGLVEVCTH